MNLNFLEIHKIKVIKSNDFYAAFLAALIAALVVGSVAGYTGESIVAWFVATGGAVVIMVFFELVSNLDIGFGAGVGVMLGTGLGYLIGFITKFY